MAGLSPSLKELGDSVIGAMRAAIEKRTNPLVQRVAELEQKLAELEQRAMRYRGVFREANDYERGDCVTDGGALWFCRHPTSTRPPSDDWQLAVKSHR